MYTSNKSNDLDSVLLDIAGTAIVFDTTKQKLCAIAGEEYNTTDYPQDVYEPVGVVIMPASHTEDGLARMMSLKLMGVKTDGDEVTYGAYDVSNYSEFDNNGGIAWANPNTSDVNNLINWVLSNYSNDPRVNSIMTNISPSISYTDTTPNPYSVGGEKGVVYYTNVNDNKFAQLSNLSFIEDPDNPGYGWYDVTNNGVPAVYDVAMPSPYLKDGSANEAMRVSGTTMGITHGSVVSDIVNQYAEVSGERFDIFAATKAYSTNGTQKGDWYVPSLLELAYLAARMKEIYSTVNKMNPNFDEVFDSLLGLDESMEGAVFASWSSTLFSSSFAWFAFLSIDMSDLDVYNDYDGSVFGVAPVRN